MKKETLTKKEIESIIWIAINENKKMIDAYEFIIEKGKDIATKKEIKKWKKAMNEYKLKNGTLLEVRAMIATYGEKYD